MMPAAETAGAAPLLRLSDVHKQYPNGTVALKSLSLAIGTHEFLSLLGPSGCGKSTALRMIAGLSSVSAGRIDWREAAATGSAGDVGFVFQEPTLMPWATVFENVHLPLRLRGVGRKAAAPRVADALALVGLARFAQVYPRELSGGMKMRVSIARALITRPRIMLMDEPFAALDEITRHRLNDDVLRLWQAERFTVIFVTHSVYESVYLSSRIVVMAARPGRVIADIAIGLPYPRQAALRTTPPYNAKCAEVSRALAGALDGHGADH
jgi:NitT/TauT family transport system ATP-binding protein